MRAIPGVSSVLVACIVAACSAHRGPALAPSTATARCSGVAGATVDSGIVLLHHMTYPAARTAFERAATVDSQCAMAHWGVAMTLFQPLWPTRPNAADLQRGWAAAQRAQVLAPATGRERMLVDAAAAFFREPASADYWARIRRWDAAMSAAYAALPDDPDVATLSALARLAAAPPDSVGAASALAARRLAAVLKAHPDHPGALHYLVHANDTPGRENEDQGSIHRYAANAPRNPHALHMPTHVYVRQGEWDQVIAGNTAAAFAALEQPAGDSGQFVWDEFPHAIEYLVYAHLQYGDDVKAKAEVDRLHSTARLQPTFKTAFHLASTRARYALERHAWAEAMAVPPQAPAVLDWTRFPWAEAVNWFARGVGAAHLGGIDKARAAVARLTELEATAAKANEAIFTANIRILRLEVEAWLAHAAGDAATGVSRMTEAAALEVATPKHAVTPAPTIPAHEMLGDLLLAQKRPVEALAAYRRSLELYPRRLNSLLGAARAARAAGDSKASRAYYMRVMNPANTRKAVMQEAVEFTGMMP